MHIREATPNDNDDLKEVMAQCSQGTSLIVTPINTPDFFARVKAYKTYKVYIAQDGDQIMGSAACALHDVLINGTLHKIGYEFQYFTSPHYRRKGVARRLHQHIEQYLSQQGAALSSLLIVKGNLPSKRLFEDQGFKLHRDLVASALLVYEQMDVLIEQKIRSATPEDLEAISNLLNETWASYNFYEPISAEALMEFVNRTPKYSLENILLLEEDKEIVTCVGVWDWSQIMQITIQSLNPKLRMMGWVLDILRYLRPMPRMVKQGEILKQWALTPIGFKETFYLNTLLRYINNQALQNGIEQIMFACEPNHQMLNSLKGFFNASTVMQLYVKSLQQEVVIGSQPAFIDMIDF